MDVTKGTRYLKQLYEVLKQSEHFDVWHSPAPWTRNPGPEGLALGKRWPDEDRKICWNSIKGAEAAFRAP